MCMCWVQTDVSAAWKTSLWEGPVAQDLPQSLPSHTDAVISQSSHAQEVPPSFPAAGGRCCQAWAATALGLAHHCFGKHLPLIPYTTTRPPVTFLIKAPHHTPVTHHSFSRLHTLLSSAACQGDTTLASYITSLRSSLIHLQSVLRQSACPIPAIPWAQPG